MRVFIAGANQGLGLVLSRLLAERGNLVFAGHRNKPSAALAEAAAAFPGCKPVECDVTVEAQVEAAAALVREAAGAALDAVVVVAGVLASSDRTRAVTEMDTADLRRALDVNVVGTAIVVKHFHGLLRDGGKFLVITSEAGSLTNIGAKYPAYSVTKAAQNKLTAVLAATERRFTVYAVHPGRMNTVMGRENAQIEPEEAAAGIYGILSGETPVPPERGWFIDYRGQAMEI